jgi:hypothetical protein
MQDSIWCSQAASTDNFVAAPGNGSLTIAEKMSLYGASAGQSYCWSGTFGRMLNKQLTEGSVFNTVGVNASLDCSDTNLFYRQCVIPTQMAVILISVAAVVFVLALVCCGFYCGCCKCLNNKGDESKWGVCNRCAERAGGRQGPLICGRAGRSSCGQLDLIATAWRTAELLRLRAPAGINRAVGRVSGAARRA